MPLQLWTQLMVALVGDHRHPIRLSETRAFDLPASAECCRKMAHGAGGIRTPTALCASGLQPGCLAVGVCSVHEPPKRKKPGSLFWGPGFLRIMLSLDSLSRAPPRVLRIALVGGKAFEATDAID